MESIMDLEGVSRMAELTPEQRQARLNDYADLHMKVSITEFFIPSPMMIALKVRAAKTIVEGERIMQEHIQLVNKSMAKIDKLIEEFKAKWPTEEAQLESKEA